MNSMNEIVPISVIKTTKRSVRCSKAMAPEPSSAANVRQMQAELAHLRYELQALKYATQEFVRQVLYCSYPDSHPN
jgi:hypothetical protein